MLQKTLKKNHTFSGVGIHSGQTATITLQPAPENSGIRFHYNGHVIPALPAFCGETNRATCLQNKESICIKTPEHLLSALYGLGIDNLDIHTDQEEMPILDGSSAIFTAALKHDLLDQTSPKKLFKPETPLYFRDNQAEILVLPSETPQWTYILEYPDHFIGTQVAFFSENQGDYEQDIASARTYGFLKEIEVLRSKGLALGGSLDNAIVIGETDYMNPLRFDNELARHKLLDMIGDFCILGQRIQAHVIGIRSGHHHNVQMVKRCAETLS